MSTAPDPADLAPSRDPSAYGRRPLFTVTFFAWMSLCGLCLTAGLLLGRLGAPTAPAALKLEAAASEPPARTVTAPILSVPPAAPTPDVAAAPDLTERVAKLESAGSRLTSAAALALAAADLSDAAQTSAPFDQDLAAALRLAPDSADLRALAPLALRGAPTRADLAQLLPPLASQASAAAHRPGKSAGLMARLAALIGEVVVVRNIDPAAPGPDGLLARAQAQAATGDLTGAVASLDALPPAARAPLSDWIAAAERRAEIDRHIAAVRAQALAGLLQPQGAAA